ncbi:carbohydrate ABC transporter permease [Tepidibacter formicigenes]|jgi:multiple sugar transport system permease protein|uniref:Multiple sugar transport system permease protein n=1 Tax=Tepidibacter formicigenes DSM 15518 TaxID=1123349 RepID=A0A1M6KIN5_9FIRM|nr:sugar ABC transporter permease [Tepidibacter formicigenes]SHJ58822.1 multiple sugar transport system permease protein [Tepidibacter formicigenes DSM 15518]
MKKLSIYGYIFPLGILLTSFYVIPIIMSIYFSFTKYNIMSPAKFIGIKNYLNLGKDRMFIASLKNTFQFTIVVVPLQTLFSLIMAVWLTNREKSKLTELVKGVMFIPVISSMILIGIVWRILLNGDTSPLNSIFTFIGLNPPNWIGNIKTALPTLMMIAIWKNTGYFMVIYIAGIMDIPKSYYESAKVDGASKWQEFWYITVPLLKPTTILVVFLGFIWSFQMFDLVYTLTGGGPGVATMTMVLHIYNLAFKQFNFGYAMAVANVLFFIIAVISILQKKFLKKDQSVY